MRRGALIGVVVLILATVAAATASVFLRREREPIIIGVVHSLTGPLAVSERPLIDAYRLAVEEINAAGGVTGRPIELEVRDGASRPEVFARELDLLLRNPRVAVVAGAWSSAARKAMLPVLERHGGLLLYPVPFEGLERSPHVVYLGAVPNQQAGPAIEWAVQRGATRAFLVGSDSIHPHVAHAIARDMLTARGVEVVGEAYVPLDGGDLRPLAQRIAESKPDLILSTVHGETNAALMRSLRDAGVGPDRVLHISLSLTEPAIRTMGAGLFADSILAGSYFQRADLPASQMFLHALRGLSGEGAAAGDAMVSAYIGLKLWARAAADAGSTAPSAVHRSLRGRHLEGPGGTFAIDPESHHPWKPMRLGRVRPDGEVEILWESRTPIPPEPWPMWRGEREWREMMEALRRGWGGAWEGRGS